MTRMILEIPRPATAMMTNISGKAGITRTPSVTRMRIASNRPPLYPAARPIVQPTNTIMSAAVKPTNSEMRAP